MLRLCAATRVRSRPATEMVPVSGVSRPAMMRSNVVLPQPEGPSSDTNSPRLTAMLSSLSTVAAPKRFETRST